MNLYEALFEVVKNDYDVNNDDPWYCAESLAIARIYSALERVKYKPFLDWCKEIEDKEEIVKSDTVKCKDKGTYKVYHDEILADMESLSPSEIEYKFL